MLRPPLESAHYRFIRYRQSLADCLEVASVGQGDSYDNALSGALNFLSHAEFIRNKASWTSIDDIELATAEWVHWYNPVRPHSAIGMHALIEHEHAHHPRTGAEVEDPDVADCPLPESTTTRYDSRHKAQGLTYRVLTRTLSPPSTGGASVGRRTAAPCCMTRLCLRRPTRAMR